MVSPELDAVFIPARDLAERLNVTPNTANMWAKTGRMPAYQIGKSWIVLAVEFETWLASTNNAPGASSHTATIAALQDPLADVPEILTPSELAAILHVSKPVADSYLSQNEIPHYRVGSRRRIPKTGLRTFLENVRNS